MKREPEYPPEPEEAAPFPRKSRRNGAIRWWKLMTVLRGRHRHGEWPVLTELSPWDRAPAGWASVTYRQARDVWVNLWQEAEKEIPPSLYGYVWWLIADRIAAWAYPRPQVTKALLADKWTRHELGYALWLVFLCGWAACRAYGREGPAGERVELPPRLRKELSDLLGSDDP